MMRVFWLGQGTVLCAMLSEAGATACIDELREFAETEGTSIGEIGHCAQEK